MWQNPIDQDRVGTRTRSGLTFRTNATQQLKLQSAVWSLRTGNTCPVPLAQVGIPRDYRVRAEGVTIAKGARMVCDFVNDHADFACFKIPASHDVKLPGLR